MEKIKQRGLRKVLYVSVEENKRLEQAFKIVYNPIVKKSISEEVEKISKYTTRREWPSIKERELIKAYLSETIEEYQEKMQEIKEGNKENRIGMMLIKEFEKKVEKQIVEEPKEVRHLICSYSTRTNLKRTLRNIEKEYDRIEDLEDLFKKRQEYFKTFERTKMYSKIEWTEILNKLYEIKYEEIKEYI